MGEPWKAQFEIETEHAKQIITSQFPRLYPFHTKYYGSGWDHKVFLVNDLVVFRFPRRQFGADNIEKELKLLPALTKVLPLAVPNPTYVGTPTMDFQWPFMGYVLLSGMPASQMELSLAQRHALAPWLGHFLAVLHQAETLSEGPLHLPTGPQRTETQKRVPQAIENLHKIETWNLFSSLKPLFNILEAAPKIPQEAPENMVCIHGDLYAKHLILDSAARLTGIIDWGDSMKGDRAVDLSIAHSFLPISSHKAFLEAYGQVDEACWERARWFAIFHTTLVSTWSRSVGEERVFKETCFALNTLLDGAQS